MEEVFASLTALGAYLARMQAQRQTRTVFRLEADYSLSQLHQALDMLLPMVQRHTRHIRREGRGWTVAMTLGYRTGVRLADAWRTDDLSRLTVKERLTLACAEDIVRQMPRACPADQLTLRLAGTLAARTGYFSPPPGRPGYSGAVDAAAALTRGRANCQGVSDGMYLLGSVAGLTMGYQAGWNRHGPHLWNTVCLGGAWYALDVTATLQAPGSTALMDQEACRACGLRWEAWAEASPIAGKSGILASG